MLLCRLQASIAQVLWRSKHSANLGFEPVSSMTADVKGWVECLSSRSSFNACCLGRALSRGACCCTQVCRLAQAKGGLQGVKNTFHERCCLRLLKLVQTSLHSAMKKHKQLDQAADQVTEVVKG